LRRREWARKELEDMRILVTGGAGFIGSHVVDRYLGEGHQVAVVDNLATGRRENLKPDASFHEVDITDLDALSRTVEQEQPDLISHHAAQMDVRRSVKEPQFDANTNIVGTINVLEAALAVGASKLIFASSGGAIYGEPAQIPAGESHPLRPISHYGASKLAGEVYVQLYGELYDLKYTILRYANVYGPRQNPHGESGVNAIFTGLMLEGQRPTIFGQGYKTRDYVYVGDVVEANVLALGRGEGEILNIGTGIETSDQEVYDAVAAATGFEEPPQYGEERPGDVRHTALDATRAKEVLGWKPTVALPEGVAMTVDYQREHG
jgi:UDP-glucose 4-epimerase